ncbi:YfhJ family protein [Bacillus sp. UNC438CL73TsuS30]|uniref:YfhJ family protein n=1 Tax=Bacillus sp. UNC438CL73TsuS30 TaxID=1340434 RepID=UPI0004796DC0|nr:YfhJ family protein [Bacillus sp. UNC438CL73TsuS30]
MNEYQQRLTQCLMAKNNQLTNDEAQTWIELLWDDFETTAAKAGRDYLGSEMTERIVRQWIENYGGRLHDFIATNPKYKDFLNKKR